MSPARSVTYRDRFGPFRGRFTTFGGGPACFWKHLQRRSRPAAGINESLADVFARADLAIGANAGFPASRARPPAVELIAASTVLPVES
ncbi:hypothetical protein ABID19_005467 [Mesorhizobium robiniae]|uniref:Uncharacterized protein n=1 Tax=Mesorhizobium robiniae TaxID=559315 RepID=A0ABV2GVV6_9HYPH